MQQLPVDTQASGVTILKRCWQQHLFASSNRPIPLAQKNAPARGLPGHSKEGVHRNSANPCRVAEAHGRFVTKVTCYENRAG